jgi:hypothetical protein
VQAQVTLPPVSPRATITQKVGLTSVSINYSRPSVGGRKIFGDLVPFRPGLAHRGKPVYQNFILPRALRLEGNRVPAGKYALYTIPGANSNGRLSFTATQLFGVQRNTTPKMT